jgi:chromosome segregation ATPase
MEKEKTIHTKDGEIQSLSSQIDILRKENESFEVEVQSLKREKKALQDVIYRNEQEKKSVELELATQARELDRVRKIKWYQKLLGKE